MNTLDKSCIFTDYISFFIISILYVHHHIHHSLECRQLMQYYNLLIKLPLNQLFPIIGNKQMPDDI